MKYVEFVNAHGSQMIDDTYANYRLLCTLALNRMRHHNMRPSVSGAHVAIDGSGQKVYTYPYLDYLNGKVYTSPDGYLADVPSATSLLLDSTLQEPIIHKYIGSPYLWRAKYAPSPGDYVAQAYARILIRRLIIPMGGDRFDETMRPCWVAIGSSMPNVVYSFNQFAASKDTIGREIPYVRILSMWQLADSISISLCNGASTFNGSNVGYTEFDRTTTQKDASWEYRIGLKPRDNANFTAMSFTDTVELAPTLFVYGLAPHTIVSGHPTQVTWTESIAEKGELVIRRADGRVVFNNRYDYMRVLQYLPDVNALVMDGKNLRNAPLRLTFPGRKIAVVSVAPYAYPVLTGSGKPPVAFSTGFYLPDPSTVEFTTCITSPAGYNYSMGTVNEYGVKMAALKNVMILNVTGCDPWWYNNISK